MHNGVVDQALTRALKQSSRYFHTTNIFAVLAVCVTSSCAAEQPGASTQTAPEQTSLAIPAASPSGPVSTAISNRASSKTAPVVPEGNIGVDDAGIWSDLDHSVTLPAPRLSSPGALVWNPAKSVAVIHERPNASGRALKVYPAAESPTKSQQTAVELSGTRLFFRPGDGAEVNSVLAHLTLVALGVNDDVPGGDADDDGIPNQLDILIGANKTALNKASYGAGYIQLGYPNGDVPRDVGVCTDVVIRAARNAGVDLQSELHRDISVAKRAYPMVKKRNAHIDHRRVKTLLPYFLRHWGKRSSDIASEDDPLVPGDVIFMDTFPSRPGPDHIGIVSSTLGASGHPTVINNWTDGAVTEEMDFLSFVPVTHRFRMK